jgi:hypothetical protein
LAEGDIQAGPAMKEALLRSTSPFTNEPAEYTATISTPTVDRSFDTIAIEGWDFEEYIKSNAIILFNHAANEPPIGKSIAVWRSGLKLKAAMRLAPDEANPMAAKVRHLIDGGYLRAASVAFVPLSWEFARDSSRPNGINFLRQRLIEFSIVNLPSNPQATIDRHPVAVGAGKSGGNGEAQIRRENVLAALKREPAR